MSHTSAIIITAAVLAVLYSVYARGHFLTPITERQEVKPASSFQFDGRRLFLLLLSGTCLVVAVRAQIAYANFQFLIFWLLGLFALTLTFFMKGCDYKFVQKRDWVPLTLVFLAALIPRLWLFRLSDLNHFEAIWGRDLLRIVSGQKDSFFSWVGDFPANTPTATMVWAYYLFPEDPYVYLRLSMVIQGAICAALAFLTARHIFNSSLVAYCTGLAWAFSAWTINESLYACTFSTYQMIQWLMLALTAVAFRSLSNPATAVILGITAGMLLNMLYVQMTSFLAVYAVLLLVFFAVDKGLKLTILWRGCLYTLGFIAAAFPTAIRHFILADGVFDRHISNVTFEGQRSRWAMENILDTSWSIVNDYLIYDGFQSQLTLFHEPYWPPILDIVSNHLFWIGLILCLIWFYRSWPFYLNFLFVAIFAPVVFRPESYYRLSGIAPIIYLYIAITFAGLIQLISLARWKHSWLQVVTCFSLISILMWCNVEIMHLGIERKVHHQITSRTSVLNAMGREILARHHTCHFQITGLHTDDQNINFFRDAAAVKNNVNVSIVRDIRDLVIPPDDFGKGTCYLVTDFDYGLPMDAVLDFLNNIYPEAPAQSLRTLAGKSLNASLVFIPANLLRRRFAHTARELRLIQQNDCTTCVYQAAVLFPLSGRIKLRSAAPGTSILINDTTIRYGEEILERYVLRGLEPAVLTVEKDSDKPLLEWMDPNGTGYSPLAFIAFPYLEPVATSIKLSDESLVRHTSSSFSEVCESLLFRQYSKNTEISKVAKIKAPNTGKYILQTEGNIAHKIYLNGTTVIDSQELSWHHKSAEIELEERQVYELNVVFPPQQHRRHCFYLRWKSPGKPILHTLEAVS